MIRILILASIGAVISADPSFRDYPFGLASLFAAKREAVAAKETKETTVCDSNECKQIAKTIKESMDESVDPCDDFYQYACGKWDNLNDESESESLPSLWGMVMKKIEKQVEGLMKSPIEPDDIFAVKLAKKWYRSCMEDKADESLEPLLATLWRHGGWPLIMENGEWNDRIYNWQIVDDQYARLTGINAFFDMLSAQLSMDGNETLILDTPHLLPGIYRLLPDPYQGSDTSDENNESGEGSQEKGSKEKTGPKDDEGKEEDEEDEGIEEDAEPEDETEENARMKRVLSGRRSRGKKLDHGRRSSSKHSVGRRHREKNVGKRTKRNIVEEIVLRSRRSLKRRSSQHGVVQRKSRKSGRKSTAHRHIPTSHLKKSAAGKSDPKRSGKSADKGVKKVHARKRVVHRNNGKSDEVEAHLRKKNINHHYGHELEKVHAKRRIQQKVHHVVREIAIETTHEPPKDDDEKNEDSGDNDVDTGDDGKDDGEDGGNDDGEDGEKGEEEESSGANEEEEAEPEEEPEETEEDEEDEEEAIEKLKETLREYVMNAALTLSKVRGIEVSRKKIEKGTDDLLEFMLKLAEITLSDYELENTTLSGFQDWYDDLGTHKQTSKVNWKRKVQKLFNEAGLEIDDEMEVTLSQTEYFENLYQLLDETPAEVIVNYIHWLFISTVGVLTSEDLRLLSKDWEPRTTSDRGERCTQVELSDVIGYEYTKKHFPQQLERMARDMIDDIQKEIEHQIKASTWLDEDTKHFILSKLVHLEHIVGSPDWYRNETMVQQYFQGLTIGPSYYDNLLNYMRYLKWKKLRLLLIPDELPPLSMDPLMVNAFFMPTENVIAISAADLQNPFFAANRPWNLNFGIIGSIIGHEVNHGFDDSGHLYNRKGEPTEWLSAMATAYDKRAECFVEQYNNYDIVKGEDFKIKDYGNQTAGENIADTMGLEAVWGAYHRRLRQCNRPDPLLPGLEKFSSNQTFFLAFANLWCEVQDPDSLKRSSKHDVHSPGRLRVIGSVSNLNGFAESFNCPAGSPMNPKKKCNIWI